MPTQMFEYSSWSNSRISTPPATTTMVVAVTMTPAAVRTDGGSLRNRVRRRSVRSDRATCATLPRPVVLALTPFGPDRAEDSADHRDGDDDQDVGEEGDDDAERAERFSVLVQRGSDPERGGGDRPADDERREERPG